MVSIDLAILGAEPTTYDAYLTDIRREYAHVPEPMWRMGRDNVLKHLLKADPLYAGAGHRKRLQQQARRNLARKPVALSAG